MSLKIRKSKEIKVKHVYYVDFNPVRESEFKDNHLAVVLRKNNNASNRGDETFIVIPLTKKETKDDSSMEIKINGLPSRISKNKSFAIGNKVRCVNYSRFSYIVDKNNLCKDIKVDDNTFVKLMEHSIVNLEHNLSIEEKIELHKNRLDILTIEYIINLAYKIKNAKEDIDIIENKILDIIKRNSTNLFKIENYNIYPKPIDKDILKIIEKIIEKTCTNPN